MATQSREMGELKWHKSLSPPEYLRISSWASIMTRLGPLQAKLRSVVLRTEIGYYLDLKSRFGIERPLGYPNAPWGNGVLKTCREWGNALEQVKRLGLPPYADLQKNWDSLAALDCILKRNNRRSFILDAGAESYSMILPWLFLYGYKNLIGINLVFNQPVRRGPIRYEYGDITKTRFKDNTFDAITCLSVIEHGVNLEAYFGEMSRILKPRGILITSTDYYVTHIDTKGATAYGVPVHIFTREEIITALDVAGRFDLKLTGPLNLESEDKTVRWQEFSLDYTFLIFTLQKRKPDDA